MSRRIDDGGAGIARELPARRLSLSGVPPSEGTESVAVEGVLSIDVKDAGVYTLMCTPADVRAFATGFLFSEGLIDSIDEVNVLAFCEEEPGVVRVELANPERAREGARTLIVTSSCGMCGRGRSAEEMLAHLPAVGDTLRVPAPLLRGAGEELSARQEIFRRTGGAHAALVFGSDGAALAFAEDIGRHNALDKAIGMCLLARRPTVGGGVFLSGRVSFELVAKAARAGIELVAAVSAPFSLAVEAAERVGITLCGFVRGDRATVYAHPRRLAGRGDVPGTGGST